MSTRLLPPAANALSMPPKTAAGSKSPGVAALAPAMAELPIPKTSAMSLLPRTSGLPPKKVALGLTADRKNLINSLILPNIRTFSSLMR
jgi:hypothetical protein